MEDLEDCLLPGECIEQETVNSVTVYRIAKKETPNDFPALVMPLSALKALWAAKWGAEWTVPSQWRATEDSDFWVKGFNRLQQNGGFEMFDDGGVAKTVWYRLKEEK